MKISVNAIENVVLGTSVFVLSGALLGMLVPAQSVPGEGSPTFRFILAALYLGVGIIAFRVTRREQTLQIISRNPALPALLSLAFISAFWSAIPLLVMQRGIAVAGTSLVGVALASCLTSEDELRLLSRVFRLAAGLSLACMIVAPGLAFSDIGMRGVFDHKNTMGEIMALAILVEHYVPATNRRSKLAKLIWICAYAGLLLLSKSAGSIMALCVALIIIFAFKVLRLRHRVPLRLVVAGLICAIALVAAMLVSDRSWLSLAGRSSDLTGRTELWSMVVDAIKRRPFVGYGYASFWSGISLESSALQNRIGWDPLYSHNGYLETLLSLGLAGFLLLLVMLGTGFKRALQLAEDQGARENIWPLAFLVFFAIHNLVECTILWQNCLAWTIFIAVVARADTKLQPVAVELAYRVDSFRGPSPEYAGEET